MEEWNSNDDVIYVHCIGMYEYYCIFVYNINNVNWFRTFKPILIMSNCVLIPPWWTKILRRHQNIMTCFSLAKPRKLMYRPITVIWCSEEQGCTWRVLPRPAVSGRSSDLGTNGAELTDGNNCLCWIWSPASCMCIRVLEKCKFLWRSAISGLPSFIVVKSSSLRSLAFFLKRMEVAHSCRFFRLV